MHLVVENRPYWHNVYSCVQRQSSWPDDALVILVSLQNELAYLKGVDDQSKLTGKRLYDVKIEPQFEDGTRWSANQAHNYCEAALSEFKQQGEGKAPEQIDDSLLRALQNSENFRYLGEAVIAPSGLGAQEIIVPANKLQSLIGEAESDVTAFRTLEAAGFQCIRVGLLDRQPSVFKVWFEKVVTKQLKAPGRRPKFWANLMRDHLLVIMVDTLISHGIQVSKNPTTDSDHAFQIVADAFRKAKISSVRTAKTVSDIYYKSR